MSPNPLQIFLKPCENLIHCLHTHLSNLIGDHLSLEKKEPGQPLLFSLAPKFKIAPASNERIDDLPSSRLGSALEKRQTAKPLSKEELGRATWTFLHSLAAQYPDHPTRQQKRDVKELMAILSRLYPCRECADHFKEILKVNPVRAETHEDFSQWLCRVHNVVNRSLGKVSFPCQRVDARWGKLDCENRACDLEGTRSNF